jgi:hypothetical protein
MFHPDSDLSLLAPERHHVAPEIIEVVLDDNDELMVLEGSPVTGKIFAVKALIKAFQFHCGKYLFCGNNWHCRCSVSW